ncbi:hypothetical protein EDD17DRAFT_1766450 [Pisolithus thermaeus]|nr:hypothetical protein EV401DRAFT_2146922 [Pisolithus croceorrhizus]KAI6149127.1 hypothetical protein EDD17DRAFT_1766450 [Pisolithus thermaeus]
MASPIAIRYPSQKSGGLYVPVHRRGDSKPLSVSGISPSSSYTISSRASSPSPSEAASISSLTSDFSSSLHIGRPVIVSSSPSQGHAPNIPIYTPADLLLLSTSPLSKLSKECKDALHSAVPEVVLTRKRRKAQEWRARQGGSSHQNLHSNPRPANKLPQHSSHRPESDEPTWRKSI